MTYRDHTTPGMLSEREARMNIRDSGRGNMKENRSYFSDPDSLPQYISVISSTQCARIRIDSIQAIEQEGRKLHIITPERDYSFYENINAVIMSLGGRAFYRPMKSVIINFDHVMDITGRSVNFYSGQSLTLGQNSSVRTRQAFKRYLRQYPPYSLWTPPAYSMVAERSEAMQMPREGGRTEPHSEDRGRSSDGKGEKLTFRDIPLSNPIRYMDDLEHRTDDAAGGSGTRKRYREDEEIVSRGSVS